LKKTVAYLSALAALGGGVLLGGYGVSAQQPGSAAPAGGAAASPARTKIGLVNMAKVLKRYEKGNQVVQQLQDLRNSYIAQVNKKRAEIADIQKQMEKLTLPAEREKMEGLITQLQRDIQDIDKRAQKELGTLSNDTLVQVYKEIKSVIDAVAQSQDLDMILSYLDAVTDQEANTAAIAQLKLQAPAAMPLYHKPSMDYTEMVILTLNKHYPALQQKAAAPAANNGVVPASGTQPGNPAAGQPRQ
jgi:Skp family chaperone for outer membrane proteins